MNQCPHDQYVHDCPLEAHAPVSLCLRRARSKQCVECDMLLKVIEEYKPGWISGDHAIDEGLHIVLEHGNGSDCPAIIRLVEGTIMQPYFRSEVTGEVEYEEMVVVDSFSYFRKLKDGELIYPGRSSFVHQEILFDSMAISKDSSQPDAFERVAGWLSRCIKEDERCMNPNPEYMPRRLLHVGSENKNLFLFEPTRAAPYICLSYCWGKDVEDVLKTTKHNLEAHYTSVPFVQLCAAIKDAIIVCRGLKVENLWVDSLCIIQDDLASWLQDSAQMGNIYANSQLTIASEESPSCKVGFLGKQEYGTSEWQREISINVPEKAGGPRNEIFIRPMPHPDAKKRVERCSLDKRGWCLQEAILSSRRICYNGRELIWDCASCRICECGHLRWEHNYKPRYTGIGSQLHHGHLYKPNQHGQTSPHKDWITLVEDYSQRSFTHGSDKLVAISGIAKMMVANFWNWKVKPEIDLTGLSILDWNTDETETDSDKETEKTGLPRTTTKAGKASHVLQKIHCEWGNDVYRAGLWRDKFIVSLSWRVLKLGRRDLNSYVAPTWSWASINTAVRYDYFLQGLRGSWREQPHVDIYCTVQDTVITPALTSDLTGSIKAAHVLMTGRLVPVDLVFLDEALTNSWLKNFYKPWIRVTGDAEEPTVLARASNVSNIFSVEILLDEPVESSLMRKLVNTDNDSDCWIRGSCISNDCCQKTGKLNMPVGTSRYYCLKLFDCDDDSYDNHSPKGVDEWFLILQKLVDAEDAYERVGVGVWNACQDCRLPSVNAVSGWTATLPLFESFDIQTITIR